MSSYPGSRYDTVYWRDSNDKVWLFGGSPGIKSIGKHSFVHTDLPSQNIQIFGFSTTQTGFGFGLKT